MVDTREIERSPEFNSLVRNRWQIATFLLILQFIAYYGFILLVAYAKPTLAIKVGAVTTLGIVLGMLVIVVTFLLTLVYVIWANKVYDDSVNATIRKIKTV
jgi:uncharacterized membrane protein (DUF485 family)